jgi:tetratricopeptide (TPR) repeat protein
VVVLCGALAAGAASAVAVVLLTGGGGSDASTVPSLTTPFAGAPPLRIDLPGHVPDSSAAQVRAAERAFPAGDVRIKVARIMDGYTRNGADATLAALRALPRDQAVVSLHLGLAEIWAGQRSAGLSDLKRTRVLDPYGFYGSLADDTLHTDQRPGYPLYIEPGGMPSGDAKHLRALAARQPNRSDVWLALAYQLQQTDHVEALKDARKALELDPTGVSPRVAVAVLAYSKDDPSAAFSVLGPLAQQASDASEIRFHLGELLYWLKQDTDAKAQWRQVEQDSPGSVYGLLSIRLMSKIPAAG